jgi:hypothetical protein
VELRSSVLAAAAGHDHQSCSSCLDYALVWRARLLNTLTLPGTDAVGNLEPMGKARWVSTGSGGARAAKECAGKDTCQQWAAGNVVQDRITHALDMHGLDGPELDAACGVAEPQVDWWDRGLLYPTCEQLRRLAALTQVHPGFFMIQPSAAFDSNATSLRFHVNSRQLGKPEPPVGRARKRRGAPACHRRTHQPIGNVAQFAHNPQLSRGNRNCRIRRL